MWHLLFEVDQKQGKQLRFGKKQPYPVKKHKLYALELGILDWESK